MKKILKISVLNAFIVAFLGAVFIIQPVLAAGTATLSISPSSGTYVVGNTVNVNIYEDSGSDSVNAVQANFSYPSSLLSFVGVTDSAAFGISAQNSVGGGTGKIGRGTFSPVSGSQLVATVKFTATAAGSATITFTSGSAVVRSSDNGSETLTTSGATFTINNPASPNPGSTGSNTQTTTKKTTTTTTKTTTPTPSSSTPQQPAPAADTTPPAITSVSSTNVSTSSATVTWQTSEPATSEVDIGFSSQYIFSAVDSNLTKNHSVVIPAKYITPGATYHYIVKSTDQAGNLAVSKELSFKTVAAEVPAKPKSNNFWPALLVVVIIGGIALGAANYIHRMKSRINTKNEPNTGPSNRQSQGTVITPEATATQPTQKTPENKV